MGSLHGTPRLVLAVVAGALGDEVQESMIGDLQKKLRMSEEQERKAAERGKDYLPLQMAAKQAEEEVAALLQQKELKRTEERKRDEVKLRRVAEGMEQKCDKKMPAGDVFGRGAVAV